MKPILTDLSPASLALAIEANLCENYEYFCSAPGTELQAPGDMVRFITGIPDTNLNGVIRTVLPADGIEGRIDDTLAHFRARRMPMIWWLGPSTRPVDLGPRLEARGLRFAARMPGMACDLRALNEDVEAPPALLVGPVRNRRQLTHWMEAFSGGFGAPAATTRGWHRLNLVLGLGEHMPWRLYVGTLHGQPVGTAAVYVGAGVAGIYCVSTIPAARRRGIGAAMVVAALADAREEGFRAGILHSSEMAVGVYRRLGFEEYCSIGAYSWNGQDARQGLAALPGREGELIAR